MLSVGSYQPDYVRRCRERFASQIASYRRLVSGRPADNVVAFESGYLCSLILALDHYFDHRARGQEGKDGNALNEVRVICNSLMVGTVLVADSQIKLEPAKSVLGLSAGDAIALSAAQFEKLSAAFFTEISKRYP